MVRTETRERCKRHPNHKQSKGVCPSCLKEKLSHLSASSSSTTANTSSTTTSTPFSYDSNISSYPSSPPHQDNNTRRSSHLLKEKVDNGFKGLVGKTEPLTKSRSLAFVISERREEEEEEEREEKNKTKKKKKRGGFWAKLMVGSGKRREEDGGLVHSKTMKEKSSAKWVFFS